MSHDRPTYGGYWEFDSELEANLFAASCNGAEYGIIDVWAEPMTKKWYVTQYLRSACGPIREKPEGQSFVKGEIIAVLD